MLLIGRSVNKSGEGDIGNKKYVLLFKSPNKREGQVRQFMADRLSCTSEGNVKLAMRENVRPQPVSCVEQQCLSFAFARGGVANMFLAARSGVVSEQRSASVAVEGSPVRHFRRFFFVFVFCEQRAALVHCCERREYHQ